MTKEQKIIRAKVGLLELARQLGRPAYGQIRIAKRASQAQPFDFAGRGARGLATP